MTETEKLIKAEAEDTAAALEKVVQEANAKMVKVLEQHFYQLIGKFVKEQDKHISDWVKEVAERRAEKLTFTKTRK